MKPARSCRRWLLVAAGLLVLFTITGFLVLPPIVKSQLEKRLSIELDRRVTVGKVRLNPYALSLTLENFAIQERAQPGPFLGWQRLYVNFDALSSLRGEWVLSEVALDGFEARVQVNRDQSLNFSDLLTKFAPPAAPAPVAAPAKPARPVRIARLQVSGARMELADASRPRPFATTLGPVSFDLTGFRTVSESGAPYHFEATTEAGEKLAWSGTLRADPLQSAGELRLENISLPKYAAYYADRMQAELVAGKFSIRGRYEIDFAEAHRVMKILEANVQVRDLALEEPATRTNAVELKAFDVTGVEIDALAQKAAVASVTLTDGHIRARREKDGSVNLLTMLKPGAPAAPPVAAGAAAGGAPSAAPAKAPDVTIGVVALKDFQIEIADLAAPRPAQLALNSLQLSLQKVTLAAGARIPLQLAFDWAPQGKIKLDGGVVLAPLEADLKIDVTGLELLPLSPYLEQFADAHLTQGAVTVALEAKAALPEGKPPVATVAGDIQVDKLGLVDGAHNEELAGLGQLVLRGLRATTDPNLAVTLEEIRLTGPYARVVVNSDKSLNLATVARIPVAPAADAPAAVVAPTPAPAAAAAPPATPPANSPAINIGKIAIADGDFRFTDRSLAPNVSMAINGFSGTITGLSSTNPAKAEVDLKAMVDGAGPVAITGKLDPLGAKKSIDLKVDFRNVDLQPLSSYSGKFAGYELARGKLELDVKLLVDGPKIQATNVITLHQFTFGSPTQSPDATSLPVRLGVALLKDIDGRIVIDVPVEGSTDDPSFRIGRVVLRVVVNLLTKAAVSPFALLGAAFGGGGDELAYQQFAAGSSAIDAAEARKLETMVKALNNRPGLSVSLEGGFDAAADAYALKRVKLADEIRRTIWEAKHRADPNIPPPDQLVITPEENAATLKRLYDEKFPPGTQFGTPLPSPPAIVAPPEPPAGFFQRLVRAVTGQAKTEQRAAEQENARRAAAHKEAVATALATGQPVEEMSGRLAEAIGIDDNDLRGLAQARAQQVRDYFVVTGKIAAERVFLANATASNSPDPAPAGKGPRVFLQLQ